MVHISAGLLADALAEETRAVFAEVAALPIRATLPDPMVDEAGRRVETGTEWSLRRGEMKRILEHYAIGRMPPAPGNVVGHEIGSRMLLAGGVSFRQVHLAFGPQSKLGLDVTFLQPTGAGPFPTIVIPSFKPIPLPAPGHANQIEEFVAQFAAPLHRGHAIATFHYQQCADDRPNSGANGFFSAYPEYDWGTLAAYAWGMSRCVDYLESQPFVDVTRLIAAGHSRLGKVALIAGAFDERFALTAPAGSGCGGTGAYRFNGKGRGGKEGLEEMTKRFPHWFVPRLAEFSGQVEKLPFDQHWFIALIAPRRVIIADGLDDPYCNGMALLRAYQAAKPTYELLGVADHLGINFRPGKHFLAAEDWEAILDFSDQQLGRLKVSRSFDQLPLPIQLH